MGVASDVNQEIAQQPIDEPRPRWLALPGRRYQRECDVEFVEQILPRLVDARCLTRRSDEQAREQVGQRGMPLHIEDQALKQVRRAQEWTVGCRLTAEHD